MQAEGILDARGKGRNVSSLVESINSFSGRKFSRDDDDMLEIIQLKTELLKKKNKVKPPE